MNVLFIDTSSLTINMCMIFFFLSIEYIIVLCDEILKKRRNTTIKRLNSDLSKLIYFIDWVVFIFLLLAITYFILVQCPTTRKETLENTEGAIKMNHPEKLTNKHKRIPKGQSKWTIQRNWQINVRYQNEQSRETDK